MTQFRVVFWYVDAWNADYDGFRETVVQAIGPDDAVRQFKKEYPGRVGQEHTIQFVEEVEE